ncbi:hypothetical protein [Acidiphilium sp. JA12-A1]|uniref:hypothetical protein n=1 Tax=Acidiphilium sp. JA12-A1 TaxID=1464546 RepID=UPI0004616EEF|nr:hypothetical protein [Acidiphilium sp. JA12-A1]KDM66814.1 hypothetical protein ACIDI_52c00030 [Acidiphilium sp. JA12-A1]
MDPAAIKRVGGVIKLVPSKQLPPMIEDHLAAYPRVAVSEYISVCELMEEAKAPTRGRWRLNARLGAALRSAISQKRHHAAKLCARTKS